MVNAFGYYASAKGMVLVPDLSGLSSAAAIALLESNGLNYSLGSDVDTNNGALDNLVAEQSPVSNTLVDYDTVVQFRLYNLISVPPFFPSFPPDFPPPSLPTPTFQLSLIGNAAGGNRNVIVYLTNYDTYAALGGVTFSPEWTSFEGTYPEYYREGPPNTDVTIEVTVSKSGYSNATGSITVNYGEYTGTPTPSPTPSRTEVSREVVRSCESDSNCLSGGSQTVRIYYSDGTNVLTDECCQFTPTPSPTPGPSPTTTWYCRYVEVGNETSTFQSGTDVSNCTPGVAATLCSTVSTPTIGQVKGSCSGL
jgi:hypothetical protein